MREKVGVIGLGYIGLPLLAVLADAGYSVVGMDINQEKVDSLKQTFTADIYELGLNEALTSHRDEIKFTTSYEYLMQQCPVILITIGTPLDNNEGIPDFTGINQLIPNLGKHLKRGHLIILKSTVYPGATRKVALELEKASGLKAGSDFDIAFQPERTIEGAALSELRTIPKIVGGINSESTERAASIIQDLGGKVIKVSTPEVAELCKLIDNTYRAASIAFANEIGDICQKLGIDSYEIESAVNDAYARTHLFRPGLGADGPCLSKDPQILRYYANREGVDTKVIDACILKNRESTLRIASVTSQFLSKYKIQRPKVSLIGLAFKGSPETDDTRDAPAIKIYRALKQEINNIEFKYYDPIVKKFPADEVCQTLKECIQDTNVVMFLTNHPALMNIGVTSILSNSGRPLLIIDCWRNITDPYQLPEADVQIFRIGDGRI